MDNASDIKQYFVVLLKWWWLLLACAVVAGGSSYLGTRQMPRIYQATTTILVGQTLEQINPSGTDLWVSGQLAQTYAQLVTRRPILQRTASALGLSYVPSGANVSTKLVAGTQLMEISFRDTDPERARAIADQLASQLILETPASGEAEERQSFVRDQLRDLESKIAVTTGEIEGEQVKLQEANSARAIQQYQGNISALGQKLSSYQSTYASLLVTVQGGTNYISIVEPATTPTTPISPNVMQTVLVAVAIGLGLAVGGAFLIEYLDDTVQSAEELTRLSELPFMGGIARIAGEGYTNKLITAEHPLSSISEAYRLLRTNIKLSSVDRPLGTLMVTSSGPVEGKSVTLANLGVVFAEADMKVAIVDTDLRRPVQHNIFGLRNDKGLSDAILDPAAEIMDYTQRTEVENLILLACGQIPPNPSELLASDRFGQLMADLQGHVDMVLFDSPPALVVADAKVLGSRVDGVLLITDQGRTRRAMARRVSEELRAARVNVLGAVLNRVATSGAGYHYYNHYSRYYRDEGKPKRRLPWVGLRDRLPFSRAKRERAAEAEPLPSDSTASG